MNQRITSGRSRGGFAIVTATLVLMSLLTLAIALSESTVGSLRMAQARVSDISLTISAESIANLGFRHLQRHDDLATQLLKAQKRANDDAKTAPSHPDVNLTQSVIAAANIEDAVRLNGVEPLVTWKYLHSVPVSAEGAQTLRAIYLLTATAAAGGPARYYNPDRTKNEVPDINRYRRKRVEVLFTEVPDRRFRQAMFAYRGYNWSGTATTDSWNSGGTRTYDASTHGSNGDLASNSQIIVKDRDKVQGDVNPNLRLPIPKIPFAPPDGARAFPSGALWSTRPALGTLSTSSLAWVTDGMLGGTDAGTTYSYICSKLKASADNSIAIRPGARVDIYVDGPIDFDKKEWIIPPTSTVRIYQNEYPGAETTVLNGQKTTIGCISNPAAFQIYSRHTLWDVQLNGNSRFAGVIIAPNAVFKLNGTFDFYGSLIAKSFRETDNDDDLGLVNGSYSFHYDDALNDIPLDIPPLLQVIGWRSYELGFAQDINPDAPLEDRIQYDDP